MAEQGKPDTLMVFSGKSLNTMAKEGGCGHWVVDKDRARRCGYVVAVRNQHAPWSEYDVPHGVAWLLATIRDVVDSPEAGRSLVKLGRYAIVDKPMPWGSRNPVGYTRLADLGINAETLEWKDFQESAAGQAAPTPAQPKSTPAGNAAGSVQPLTFEQAKQGLAAAMGIRPEQIEITIRA
jgi:hypothetical protein